MFQESRGRRERSRDGLDGRNGVWRRRMLGGMVFEGKEGSETDGERSSF